MLTLCRAALVIVGLIHLLPVIGVLGAAQLTTLYGVDFSPADLEILMRHRAVLFGLLGAYLIGAAFRPAWRRTALAAGWVSVLSFLLLAWLVGDYGAPVARVVAADLVAAVCLAFATFADRRLRAANAGEATSR